MLCLEFHSRYLNITVSSQVEAFMGNVWNRENEDAGK